MEYNHHLCILQRFFCHFLNCNNNNILYINMIFKLNEWNNIGITIIIQCYLLFVENHVYSCVNLLSNISINYKYRLFSRCYHSYIVVWHTKLSYPVLRTQNLPYTSHLENILGYISSGESFITSIYYMIHLRQ